MTVSLKEQIACVRRELALRKSAYAKWVAARRMKQAAADHEIAAMQAVHDTLLEAAGESWRPIESAPAPEGYIDNYPSFFLVGESTLIRYEYDEGQAIAIIRARMNESKWEPYAWLPVAPAPKPAQGKML